MNQPPTDHLDDCVYRVDGAGRICAVNDAWLQFARDNGWQAAAASVIGSRLNDQVSDVETRQIYALIERRARATPGPVRFDFRCDSPGLRRFMRMEVRYDATTDQMEYRSHLLRTEQREPVALLDAHRSRHSAKPLDVCSWCKRVAANGAWLEVEQAVAALEVLQEPLLPAISHGICPSCAKHLRATAAAPVRVLILDDNHLLAMILGDHLREPGFAADAAFEVEQGLQLLAQHHYDVVIVDLVLPGSSGFEFLERLRQMGRESRALVITGQTLSDAQLARLEALRVEAIVEKPFGFEELVRRLERH